MRIEIVPMNTPRLSLIILDWIGEVKKKVDWGGCLLIGLQFGAGAAGLSNGLCDSIYQREYELLVAV